jgi:hypothetical protein
MTDDFPGCGKGTGELPANPFRAFEKIQEKNFLRLIILFGKIYLTKINQGEIVPYCRQTLLSFVSNAADREQSTGKVTEKATKRRLLWDPIKSIYCSSWMQVTA